MDVLIRKSTGRGTDQSASSDLSVETAQLLIGSDADADINFRGTGIADIHASISAHGNGYRLDCRRGCTVSHNGSIGKRFDLSVGDRVSIGNHQLDIIAAPTGFDLGILVAEVAGDSAQLAKSYRADLSQTGLGSRKYAWIGSILVLLLTLLFPLIHYLDKQQNTPLSAIANVLPTSDTIWTSGPLSNAHASLGDQCEACHTKLFQQVSNDTCGECHQDVQNHMEEGAIELNAHLKGIDNGRCAACHREHNEPESTLIVSNDVLCSNCHQNDELNRIEGTLPTVSDFATDKHPEFAVSVISPQTLAGSLSDPTWIASRKPVESASEQSQLLFNHNAHLSSDTEDTNPLTSLGCADCHQLNSAGEHFSPIAFETDCATSGCHDLELDARTPLPHGMPEIAIAAIEGYHLKKFGNPDAPLPGRLGLDLRRRPGSNQETSEICKQGSYDCALFLSQQKVDKLFTKSGCVTCHVVKLNEEEEPLAAEIAAVRLNTDYHPAAQFDHESHRLLIYEDADEALSGDAACNDCHSASASTTSTDVLMPAIGQCLECHNGQETGFNVPLGCAQCHVYHPESDQLVTNGLVEN